MLSINPYLNFTDQCEEAFNFYHSVFGGDAPEFSRFGEAPSQGEGDHQMPESEANKIMHASLAIGDGHTLMGSDRPESMGPTTFGNNAHISVQTKDKDEATRVFNGLAEGGNVTMPLADMFWGATFGMVVDKFGVQWMVNSEH
ncbi:MAG: VOC family protein [Chloroflexota bacterium]